MIVPSFWAEARVQQRLSGRQVTIRRFGWSDASQEEAQALADSRAREAMTRIESGQKIERRERKRAYNGSEGVPIREEIVSRHGSAVVTRNGYGARCLNTPNVMFVDVDFQTQPGWRWGCVASLLLLAPLIMLTYCSHRWVLLIPALLLAWFAGQLAAAFAYRVSQKIGGGQERMARARIEKFSADHPGWLLRLYRTPAGFRLLALHRTFDPSEAEALKCFRDLRADVLFARMCVNQRCFRARVSAKPWRIGMPRIRPRPGVWPVKPVWLELRRQWIDDYERKAAGYAACRFVVSYGQGTPHPEAIAVQALHDDWCRVDSSLPMA